MAQAPIPSTPSVSLPGTPVHSIQTVRRRIAGHHGPLTKILVANRGVRHSNQILSVLSLMLTIENLKPIMLVRALAITRKLRFASSERRMNSRCIQLLFTHTKIDSLLIDKRYALR